MTEPETTPAEGRTDRAALASRDRPGATSGPEARRTRRRRNLRVAGVLVVALALLLGGAWQLVLPLFAPEDPAELTDYPGPGGEAVEVRVEDAAPEALGETLVAADVVATVDAFTDAYAEEPDATRIEVGSYLLPSRMAAADAVSALLDPANRSDRTVTIPAGWRLDQITARVAEVLGAPLADVTAALPELELPAQAGGEAEGWLAAGRYTITPGDTPQVVLQEMVDQTVAMLTERDVASERWESVLTQASIVEAEVSTTEDRGRVARVMRNRLAGCADVGTYLQMSSTVAYGLGTSVSDLTVADLADESTPYNTFAFEGLPPTPINAPSEEAVDAVLSPPEGTWCYFVTVDLQTGETRFTDDPVEHEQNRAEYRAWLEQWRAEQSAEPTDDATTVEEG